MKQRKSKKKFNNFFHFKCINVNEFCFSLRFLYGDSAPLFALIGISLASGTGILTKDDELEGVCWEIRVSRIEFLL